MRKMNLIEKSKVNVYGYIRLPKESCEKGELEIMSELITKFCNDSGLNLIKIYIDEENLDTNYFEMSKFKGLLELLTSFDEGNRIVVINTSHLWSEAISNALIAKIIMNYNGDIESIEQPRFTLYRKNTEDISYNNMLKMLDMYERLKTNAKLAKGRSTKAAGGDKPAGSLPYGYQYSRDKKSVDLNEVEAKIVVELFEAASKGFSMSKIAESFTVKEYKTKSGKATWGANTISSMLRNDFYIGIVTHAGKKIEGNHPAIISTYLWREARASIKSKNKHKR